VQVLAAALRPAQLAVGGRAARVGRAARARVRVGG